MEQKPLLPLSIETFNKKGWGVAHLPANRVEVIGGIPGDLVNVAVLSKKRGTIRGIVREVTQPSVDRVLPRCSHVPHCGGCTWQQMDYPAQIKEKERRIKEMFSPFVEEGKFLPMIPCPDPWGYRNKMEFSFSQNRAGEQFLGLILAGSKGHVFNLSECHLTSGWFAEVVNKTREWWTQSGLRAYRFDDTGSLRTLVVRESKRTGDRLVMLTVSGNPAYAPTQAVLSRFVETIKKTLPDEGNLSIFLRVQQCIKGSETQFFEILLHGQDHLREKLLVSGSELTFKISPTSFFQPNTVQAERLYSAALQMITSPKRHALDLYAGTSTFGMVLAKRVEKVTTIELNPHAVFDAGINKEWNQIENLSICCGDVGETLKKLRADPEFIPVDLVVVDPPRVGLDKTAMEQIKSLGSNEILYVSCNPETQVTNVKEFIDAGYQVSQLQPVDQFPHTRHIENIVLLALK